MLPVRHCRIHSSAHPSHRGHAGAGFARPGPWPRAPPLTSRRADHVQTARGPAACGIPDRDGISGRPNRTADGRLGRFGRKAQVATLREFVASAFINEMGITSPAEMIEQTVHGNPLPPGVDPAGDPEITQDDLDATDAFMRFLAPPTPELRWSARSEGRRLFSRIRCSGCHTPALFTGRNNVRVLRFRVVFAYTDLLLHDMGQDLADICLGEAEPSEFRTEPLMGIRLKQAFLHDGRATTIEEAIVAHGGEATGARDRFLELSPRQRAALLRFVGSL